MVEIESCFLQLSISTILMQYLDLLVMTSVSWHKRYPIDRLESGAILRVLHQVQFTHLLSQHFFTFHFFNFNFLLFLTFFLTLFNQWLRLIFIFYLFIIIIIIIIFCNYQSQPYIGIALGAIP